MKAFGLLLRVCVSTPRAIPLLALTATVCLQRMSFATEPAPGGIDWEMLPIEDADGDWWNTFRIVSVPGVRYDIQKSGNLENPWETVATYYGSGADIYHPLFPGHEPSEPPSGTTPVILPAAGSSELHFAFIVMELTENGQLVLSWPSLESGLPVRYLLEGTTLDPVWEEFESGYFNIHGSYMMSISPRLHAVAPVPTPPVLAAEDQALAAAFVATLPQITQNIANSVAAAAVATPPLPPDPSAKGFFRIRADWSVDSDGDARFDWQELLLDGNSPYNADSDGDNIPDGEDPPVFQIGAAPAEPNRPPVAEFEHRYVEGLKGVSYLGTHIGVGGVANRSDEQSWTWGSPEFEAVILGQDFAELTGAAAALPIESPWQPGVMSMVATNLEDRNVNGDVVETEWANFKIEYRLKLPKPAPKGGCEIPLTLLKIPYKWEEPGDEWVPGVLPLGESQTITLTLAVPEGAEESTAVQLPVLHAGVNRRIVLVPADIAILEGNGTLPADGLCLQMGEAFRLDFNGIKSPANNCFIPDERITWQVSQLDAHGGFSEWEILQDGASQPVKGREVSALISDSYGCFRVRAVVSDGAQETIPFGAVRMRDATNAINGEGTKNPRLAAGQTEYLGVANCPIAEAVRDGAVKWLGSEDYAQRKNVPTKSGSSFNPDLTNKTKCNVFVTHVANDNGATTPYFYRNIVIPSAPIARDDWYFFVEKHVDLDGPGWNFIGVMEPPTTGSSGPSSEPPTPGMVAASRGLFDHGHCGILDYDGAWINAGSLTVNKFIHATHPDPKYTDYNLRMRIAP